MIQPKTATKVPEISVDSILTQIRKDLKRQKGLDIQAFETSYGNRPSKPNPLDYEGSLAQGLSARQMRPKPLEAQGSYHLNVFLAFHDADSILNAYRGVLRRSPDSIGFNHFLKSLRQGLLGKIEILGRLRYSPEGRTRRIRIKGLMLPFLCQMSSRFPVIGYLIRLTTGLLQLPKIIENIQSMDAYIHFRETFTDETLQDLAQKSDLNLTQIRSLGESKADKSDLAELESLKAAIGRKAETADLDLLHKDIDKVRAAIGEACNKIERISEKLSDDLQVHPWTGEAENSLDTMYLNFEDQYRGSRADIKERLRIYLAYLQAENRNDSPLLDIGCGRGEWLELCRENGIDALGIDLNEAMVAECRKLGLQAEKAEAIDFLVKQNSNHLGAITLFHVIEHLPHIAMVKIFDEIYRCLKPGGVAIFETPNPENIIVGAYRFYSDPTHIRPLVPETLKFVAEQRGFVNVQIKRMHKYSDYHAALGSDVFQNKWFNNEMDFALVCYKYSGLTAAGGDAI